MTKRTLLVGAIAGAAAGMAMAGVEMIYGWASSANTAWDAPMGIWAYIGGTARSAAVLRAAKQEVEKDIERPAAEAEPVTATS